jgi:putative endopeptidase
VNAALPMLDSWYDAFKIQSADKMFIPKEKRALVW